jgi:hypothetical protein
LISWGTICIGARRSGCYLRREEKEQQQYFLSYSKTRVDHSCFAWHSLVIHPDWRKRKHFVLSWGLSWLQTRSKALDLFSLKIGRAQRHNTSKIKWVPSLLRSVSANDTSIKGVFGFQLNFSFHHIECLDTCVEY